MTIQQIYTNHKKNVTNPCHNIPSTVQQHVNTTLCAMIEELEYIQGIIASGGNPGVTIFDSCCKLQKQIILD